MLRVSTGMPFADTNLISLKSWAKNFLTCRVLYTAKRTRSFNLVRDVLECGDIQVNPGPRKTNPSPKYPCSECKKALRDNQDAILCAGCNKWSHTKCLQMSHTICQYYLSMPDIEWTCTSCALPPLSDSFFRRRLRRWITEQNLEPEVSHLEGLHRRSTLQDAAEQSSIEPHEHTIPDNAKLEFLRKHFNKDLLMGHLNINSVQNKFEELNATIKSIGAPV